MACNCIWLPPGLVIFWLTCPPPPPKLHYFFTLLLSTMTYCFYNKMESAKHTSMHDIRRGSKFPQTSTNDCFLARLKQLWKNNIMQWLKFRSMDQKWVNLCKDIYEWLFLCSAKAIKPSLIKWQKSKCQPQVSRINCGYFAHVFMSGCFYAPSQLTSLDELPNEETVDLWDQQCIICERLYHAWFK